MTADSHHHQNNNSNNNNIKMETMLSRLSLRTMVPPVRTYMSRFNYKPKSPYKKPPRKEKYVYRKRDKSKYKGNPYPTLTVIMKEDIKLHGKHYTKGSVVTVPRNTMRNYLVPQRLADYGIKENFEKHGIPLPEAQGGTSMRGTCGEVVELLKGKESRGIVMHPGHHGNVEGEVMLTRHDVVNFLLKKFDVWVPLHNIELIGCENNIVTECGEYKAQINLTNEWIEPAVVVSLPLHVVEKVSKPVLGEGEELDITKEVSDDKETEDLLGDVE